MLYTVGVSLLICAVLPAYAQREITFESRNTNSSSHHKHHKLSQNSITIGVASWFNGYIPIYYERALNDVLSIQGGIGVTTRSFGNDLGYIVSGDEGKNSPNFAYYPNSDIDDSYEHYKYRHVVPSLYLSIAPKIYYDDDVMDGKYISLMCEMKQFRYRAQKVDEHLMPGLYADPTDDRLLPHTSQYQDEKVNCLDFTVNVGGHLQTRKNVVIGWSTGVGIRIASSERLDIGIVRDGVNPDHYTNGVVDYNKTKFLFTFNFIVGGCF